MWCIRKKDGQVVKEFAILVAIIAASLVGMQMYVKRGLQGRLRDLGNQISGRQFEDTQTSSGTTIQRQGGGTELEHTGTYHSTSNDTTQTSGWQHTVEQ